MTTARARIAYFNGRFLPESEVLVPFRDRGFKYGDAVFDTTRTFGHRIFKVREHVTDWIGLWGILALIPGCRRRQWPASPGRCSGGIRRSSDPTTATGSRR